jgi:hypothetical protein
MNAQELAEIGAAFEDVYEFLAGDAMTLIDPDAEDDEGIDLVGIRWEPDTDRSTFEGLEIDAAGMRNQEERNVLFLKSYLVTKQATIVPTKHFLINGDRWDFAKDKPIRTELAPLGGWQGLLMVTIRKAVELNKSTAGTEFTYAP